MNFFEDDIIWYSFSKLDDQDIYAAIKVWENRKIRFYRSLPDAKFKKTI